MSRRRRADDRRIAAAANPARPPVGGNLFDGFNAVMAPAVRPSSGDDRAWARRCVRRHARGHADYALLADILGIGAV